ncbi:3'-5' exonuclease [Aquibacillus albus]|uniref:DNA helicase-4 n=1 Tax=Aquibacillus albus TaxID=1168171 RepID=A0ABS2N4E3_9BACI|nr:DNA helicase-4 [Aquibacillus albus]
MVVAMDTVHSYKGKEEHAVIVVDAVNRSFPLIHPRNIFFEVLGNTIERVISEEKRLFYVALSRAMKSIVFLTEGGNVSPFLMNVIRKSVINPIDLNILNVPERKGTHYVVRVTNKYSFEDTYNIKSYLNENKYHWNPVDKTWNKHFDGRSFSRESILRESWIGYAKNVNISVQDEFENKIMDISLENGKIQ